MEELSLIDFLFIVFVAGPVLLSLFAVEMTMVIIALNNFMRWAEGRWWK